MPAPDAPTGFAASPTTYGILLTWNSQAGVDGFYLYRGVLANHSDEVVIPVLATYVTSGAGISHMDLGAVAGTHYYYRLQSSSLADGESTKVAADAVALVAGMTLTTARTWVRQFARNAGSSAQYSDTDVDRAIYTVGVRFCRNTKCVRTAGNVALTADSAVADVSSLSAFRPEQLLSANILTVACALTPVDWSTLYHHQIECSSTANPREIAFETPTIANVWPTPSENLTLRIRYWQNFSSWTFGASGDALTLNIPDNYLAEILSHGAPAMLQHNEPENQAWVRQAWADYLAYEKMMMGAGNLAARTSARAMQE